MRTGIWDIARNQVVANQINRIRRLGPIGTAFAPMLVALRTVPKKPLPSELLPLKASSSRASSLGPSPEAPSLQKTLEHQMGQNPPEARNLR